MSVSTQSLNPPTMKLGVCYYPEHWLENLRAKDAHLVAETCLSQVRIGQFAWTRIEPEPGQFNWASLDQSIRAFFEPSESKGDSHRP